MANKVKYTSPQCLSWLRHKFLSADELLGSIPGQGLENLSVKKKSSLKRERLKTTVKSLITVVHAAKKRVKYTILFYNECPITYYTILYSRKIAQFLNLPIPGIAQQSLIGLICPTRLITRLVLVNFIKLRTNIHCISLLYNFIIDYIKPLLLYFILNKFNFFVVFNFILF